MRRQLKYVFVLWGDKFEEAIAAIFVSELRQAGLLVKMVGLSPPYTCGVHGLILIPDLSLDEALPLAEKTMCLVIPHAPLGLGRLKNDPRFQEFLGRVTQQGAKVVVGQLNGNDINQLGLLSKATDQLLVYSDHENMVSFARQIARQLQNDDKYIQT